MKVTAASQGLAQQVTVSSESMKPDQDYMTLKCCSKQVESNRADFVMIMPHLLSHSELGGHNTFSLMHFSSCQDSVPIGLTPCLKRHFKGHEVCDTHATFYATIYSSRGFLRVCNQSTFTSLQGWHKKDYSRQLRFKITRDMM